MLCLTEPREAPSDVKAYSISSSEIRVTWKPPNPGPGRPRGYKVFIHISIFVRRFFRGLAQMFLRAIILISSSFPSTAQLLEGIWAGRGWKQTTHSKKRNLHGSDRPRRKQRLSHHSKRLQQHRPGSCQCSCHSQDENVSWVQQRNQSCDDVHKMHAIVMFAWNFVKCQATYTCGTVLNKMNVCLSLFKAPAQPPTNLMWIQEGNNISLSWDPVKAKDNESDVIGYMVTIYCFVGLIRWKANCSIFNTF